MTEVTQGPLKIEYDRIQKMAIWETAVNGKI
jgi:hypothetical protein